MRLLLALLLLLAAPAVAHAQSTTEAIAPADLAAYVGTWNLQVLGTPMGTVPGTLVVGEDGVATFAMPVLEPSPAAPTVENLRVTDGALSGSTRFFSRLVSVDFSLEFTLRPGENGVYQGEMDVAEDGVYAFTARRADG